MRARVTAPTDAAPTDRAAGRAPIEPLALLALLAALLIVEEALEGEPPRW